MPDYSDTATWTTWSTPVAIKEPTIKLVGSRGEELVTITSHISSVRVIHGSVSSSVLIKVDGREYTWASFNARKLVDVLPYVEGTTAAELPDPKSLKKVRKKALRKRDELLDILGWEHPA